MTAQWFCQKNGMQYGPYTDQQFRDLIATGQVGALDFVWTHGMASWLPASQIPGLFAAPAPPPPVPPPSPALVAPTAPAPEVAAPESPEPEVDAQPSAPVRKQVKQPSGLLSSARTKWSALSKPQKAIVGILSGLTASVLLGAIVGVVAGLILGKAYDPEAERAAATRSWDLAALQPMQLRVATSGMSLAYAPGGKYLVMLSAQQSLGVFDADSLVKIKDFGQSFGHAMAPVVYSPKGNLFAWQSTKLINVVDAANNTTLFDVPSHVGPRLNDVYNTTAIFSSDGVWFLTASDSDSKDAPQEQVALWSFKEKRLVNRIAGRSPACFTPDGKTILTSTKSPAAVEAWDVATLQKSIAKATNADAKSPASDSVKHMAISPDGKTLAIVFEASDHRVNLYDFPTMTPRGELRLAKEQNKANIQSLAFSFDGEQLAAGGGVSGVDGKSQGIVKIWHLPSTTVARLLIPAGPVGAIAFGPDGRLATLGRDASLRVWRPRQDNQGAIVCVPTANDEKRGDPQADDIAAANAVVVKKIND